MIVFCWAGFPQYAARCIGALVRVSHEETVVVATRPSVPVRGMKELAGCRVEWIDRDDKRSLREVVGEMPRVILASGWYVPAFIRYGEEVRRHGGRAIAMVDNNYVFSCKELIKALRFRLFLRRKFDAFFVPGNSGVRLLKFYGVDEGKIAKGMYAADDTLFRDGIPLAGRAKKIIFVGQFVERKNVRRMVNAFVRANKATGGEWTLDLYGCGPLQGELEAMKAKGVNIHAFVQPEQLAGIYRAARVFCLPSLEEHWGLVVHEAALSGCVLLLSTVIGAAADMLGTKNGWVFKATSESEMEQAFAKAMAMTDEQLAAAQAESLACARNASLEKFVAGVKRLLGDNT